MTESQAAYMLSDSEYPCWCPLLRGPLTILSSMTDTHRLPSCPRDPCMYSSSLAAEYTDARAHPPLVSIPRDGSICKTGPAA